MLTSLDGLGFAMPFLISKTFLIQDVPTNYNTIWSKSPLWREGSVVPSIFHSNPEVLSMQTTFG